MDMNRNLVIVIVLGLILSGSGAFASLITDSQIIQKIDTITVSSAELIENNKYTNIDLPEATSYLTTAGNYLLPEITRVYTFPYKTKITDITVTYTDTQEITILKPIQLSPQPIMDNPLQSIQGTAVLHQHHTLSRRLSPGSSALYRQGFFHH